MSLKIMDNVFLSYTRHLIYTKKKKKKKNQKQVIMSTSFEAGQDFDFST